MLLRLSAQRSAVVARPVVGALRPLQRGLCAVAEATEVPLTQQMKDDIEDMKAKIAAGRAEGSYTLAEFDAAVKAGTVDTSKLSTTLGDFNDLARKTIVKLVTKTADMSKNMPSTDLAALDWSQFESKIQDPTIVPTVKAILEKQVAAAAAAENPMLKELEELEAKIISEFNKSDGIFELASKEEKAAEATLLQCVEEMEKLTVDAAGISEVTIAEILEREPDLRAEIEEEIRNNVWAP